MVECHLAKVKVAGSNPVSRSKTKREVSTSLFVLERETGFTNPFAKQFISRLMNCAANGFASLGLPASLNLAVRP